ncbi:Spore maturation protein CgeB [Halobacillus dabanensis]|uniref:Spore maturation protein CgeB n=1 Tax=Halobacillus dabanensis TaxID=240302 RepID=A0A1I3XG71_HALDA|nr:glycosyltransferase [Halobacillus dabanensis]SFK18349.1 Spore maturation protein CgeB [Halobacillus dabanensis]
MNIVSIDKRLKSIEREQKTLQLSINQEYKEITNLKSGTVPQENKKETSKSVDSTNDKTKDYLDYRKRTADEKYFSRIKQLITDIPDSNGSKFFTKRNVNVGIVADEFLYHSFKDVANFNYLTAKNYKKYKGKLDIFFVATTWKGLNREWRGVANSKSNRRKELYEMIDFFKQDGVKIVFYSKEDPVNYDRFIDIAKKCDHIFTTAKEVVDDYKNECKNENVHILEFGVNPLYHNPVGMKSVKKFKDVFFAGSWLNKYPERQKETITIFDGVVDSGRDLKIIDRNYTIDHPDYFFPRKYVKYISPAIPHDYLQKIHKLYDWAINLNSIKYSETMFANRIYELQAIGNVILSNYSVGVNNKFPNVFMVHNKREATEILTKMPDEEVYQHQINGIRNVMSNHTTFDRFDDLLAKVGLAGKTQDPTKKVLVVADKITGSTKDIFELQTYPHKHLVALDSLTEEFKEQFDMITFIDGNRHYGDHYLEDMVNGFKYTNSDYVTKDVFYDRDQLSEGVEHDFVSIVKDKYQTVFWSDSFRLEDLVNLGKNEQVPNGYSIDHFEYNSINHVVENPTTQKNYDVTVIVPVYNNGKHLLNKCFQSLKRSSIFDQMEILLIDDGSTDPETIRATRRLYEGFENVNLYRFDGSGSGSASRPRNKGVQLATAPYVTYLDPDNEAVNDGYAELYSMMKQDDELDIVMGNMIKLDNERRSNFDYYKIVTNCLNSEEVIDPKEFLKAVNMRAHSIQTMLMKKELIIDHGLEMVESAAGQDTMFFQELMLNSKKTKVINLTIHIYYAAVAGSVTNTISKKFFEKYLILEKERLPFLVRYELLDTYMDKRFTFYFKNWYLKRLNRISEVDQKDSIDTLYKIYDLYRKHLDNKDERFKEFEDLYSKGDYEGIIKNLSS